MPGTYGMLTFEDFDAFKDREKKEKRNAKRALAKSESQPSRKKPIFRLSEPIPELEEHQKFKAKAKSKLSHVDIITEYTVSSSNFLKDIIGDSRRDTNFQTVKQLIEEKLEESTEPETTPLKQGAVMFNELILRRLEKISQTVEDETLYDKMAGLLGGDSSRIVSRFMSELKTDGIEEGHYKQFFDSLFLLNTKQSEWRTKYLSDNDNPQQCFDALGPQKTKDKCYLCCNKLTEPIECEHLLPIITALMHFWLVKQGSFPNLSEASKDLLKKEYARAHECCNRKKGSKILIKLISEGGSGKYQVDQDKIEDLILKINEECSELTISNEEECSSSIMFKFQEIVNIINSNVEEYGPNYYPLFIKYKILSAISDEHFNEIITTGRLVGGGPKNIIDSLANIFKSEYLNKVIINDIKKYSKEIDSNPKGFYSHKSKPILFNKEIKQHKTDVKHMRILKYNKPTRHGGKNKKSKTRTRKHN